MARSTLAKATGGESLVKTTTIRRFTSFLWSLSEIYELVGDAGRSTAFRKGAEALILYSDNNALWEQELTSSDGLSSIKGVGKSILALVNEYIQTGSCKRLEELKTSVTQKDVSRLGSYGYHPSTHEHPDNCWNVTIHNWVIYNGEDKIFACVEESLCLLTIHKDRTATLKWQSSCEYKDGFDEDELKEHLCHWLKPTPKKKAKTGNTLQDFIFTLSTISNLYERQGDAGRAKSFEVASENLTKFAELTKKSGTVLKSSAGYKDVKGVGKSTLEMMDEFIKTGTCSRLEELEGAGKQVALVREGEDQSGLELGVFCDEDDNEDYLFLYDPKDEYPLYTNIEDYFSEELDEAQRDEVNR